MMANEEPTGQPPRGRTRDYTIPVRLNQVSLMMAHRRQGMMRQLISILKARRIILYLLALIVIIATTKVQQIHCDQLQKQQSQPHLQATMKQSGAPKTLAAPGSAIDSNKKSRDKLLAKLSENIERQHLRMAASLQRPSKFDSGDSLPSVPQVLLPTKSSSSSKSSENDVLRDIMRMHEQPTRHQLHYMPTADRLTASAEESTSELIGGHSPSLKMLPNKVVSHLMSYIVAASGGARLPNISLPLLSAFVGASTTQNPPLQVTPAAQQSAPKPFLALPNWMKGNRKSTNHQQPTEPSTIFGDPSSSWMIADQTKADLLADSSSVQQAPTVASYASRPSSRQNRGNKEPPSLLSDDDADQRGSPRPPAVGSWLKNSANQMAQNYLQDSFREFFKLSQLPILPVGPVSTAPSVLEPRPVQQRRRGSSSSSGGGGGGGNNNNNKQHNSNEQTTAPPSGIDSSTSSTVGDRKKVTSDRRAKALEDLWRYAYILGTSMVSRKRDPLKALSTNTRPAKQQTKGRFFAQRSIGQLAADNRRQMINLAKALQRALLVKPSLSSPSTTSGRQQAANPRGVMWDMATDPTLVVTLMHLIERASVALPLGFLLMPVVQMIRTNPLSGFNLGRVLPPRALHRSVEHELLAKRLDAVDKVLSRALRSSHRESFVGVKRRR